jgi:hypothetical protein
MRFKLIAGLSALALVLTGCSDLVTNLSRDLTRSDVTKEELQTLIITRNDLQGFDIVEQTAADRALESEIFNKISSEYRVCNDSSGHYIVGDSLYNENSGVEIYSSAGAVCGGADAAKEATREYYVDMSEKTLREQLSKQGFMVNSIETSEVDLGLGKDVLSYKTLFNVKSEDINSTWTSWDVIAFSDKAVVSIVVHCYFDDLPVSTLEDLASLARSRLTNLDKGLSEPSSRTKISIPEGSRANANATINWFNSNYNTFDKVITTMNSKYFKKLNYNSSTNDFRKAYTKMCKNISKPYNQLRKVPSPPSMEAVLVYDRFVNSVFKVVKECKGVSSSNVKVNKISNKIDDSIDAYNELIDYISAMD